MILFFVYLIFHRGDIVKNIVKSGEFGKKVKNCGLTILEGLFIDRGFKPSAHYAPRSTQPFILPRSIK